MIRELQPLHLSPPPDNACSQCARQHEPDQPHDAQSLHYQYSFFADHGRWPTWKDAMAHCPPEVREVWMKELLARGVPERDL